MNAPTKVLEVNGWGLVVGEDDVPRVRDLDLGARLGFARPRKFRELVERLRRDGILKDSDVRPTVGRTRIGVAERDVVEYQLSERAALIAITKSETPLAVSITAQVIDVYLAVRHRDPRPANTVVSLDVAHGPRVGDTSERAELAALCRVVAAALSVSLHRVHGAIRREYGVPSAYAVSLLIWPTVRRYLERLALRKVALPGRHRAPVLQLVQGGASRQLGLPGVG